MPPAVPPAAAAGAAGGILSDVALVILGHNRPELLQKAVARVLRLSGVERVTLYVSVDDPASFARQRGAVAAARSDFESASGGKAPAVRVLERTPGPKAGAFEGSALFQIAEHFRFALDAVFVEGAHSSAIFLEEDLDVAPDILPAFFAMALVVAADESLWGASAWNDNAAPGGGDEARFLRTGCFPGLGWMLPRDRWTGRLRRRWPRRATTGFDHWWRQSANAAGMEWLYPEVPRTRHLASSRGSNVNSGQQRLFDAMRMASRSPDAPFPDLGYAAAAAYEADTARLVGDAERVGLEQAAALARPRLRGSAGDGGAVLVLWDEAEGPWQRVAGKIGLWPEEPRGDHRGTHVVRRGGSTIVVANRWRCPYLREGERRALGAATEVVPGRGGRSCEDVCGGVGKACARAELVGLNSCEALAGHFPCEGGCGHQVGKEIPSYVVAEAEATHRQCLVTQQVVPTCEAKHPATARLCACV